MADAPQQVVVEEIRCIECRRAWLDLGERWRVYLTADEPAEVLTYCANCARREFD